MEIKLYLTFYILSMSFLSHAQKQDTLRKYLDQNFYFTNRANFVYPALAVKSSEHWILYSTYPDTSMLLKIWFKDRNLTIKDGPYTLYHGKGIKAIEGNYHNNERIGLWKSWHKNGQLKDSGMICH